MSPAIYVALAITSNEILSNFPRKNRSFSYTYDTAIFAATSKNYRELF